MADLDGVLTENGLRVVMPNGSACYYVDDHPSGFMRHSYWRINDDGGRGKRLTGCTTITGILDTNKGPLLEWAARTNGIGIAELAFPVLSYMRQGKITAEDAAERLAWLSSHEDIWSMLERAELTFDDVRERKATVGTNVHELAFQALALGKPVPELARMTDEERGYADAVIAFWLDHSPEAEQVEQIVVDNERGTAGRLDFCGTIRICGDYGCPCQVYAAEGPGVIDAKTGFVGTSAHAQVAGYRRMLDVAGFGFKAWGAILKLSADGSYQLIAGEADEDDWLAAVDAYRRASRITSAAGKAYRARGG